MNILIPVVNNCGQCEKSLINLSDHTFILEKEWKWKLTNFTDTIHKCFICGPSALFPNSHSSSSLLVLSLTEIFLNLCLPMNFQACAHIVAVRSV